MAGRNDRIAYHNSLYDDYFYLYQLLGQVSNISEPDLVEAPIQNGYKNLLSPKTSDSFGLQLITAIMIVSAFGAISSVFILKKSS